MCVTSSENCEYVDDCLQSHVIFSRHSVFVSNAAWQRWFNKSNKEKEEEEERKRFNSFRLISFCLWSHFLSRLRIRFFAKLDGISSKHFLLYCMIRFQTSIFALSLRCVYIIYLPIANSWKRKMLIKQMGKKKREKYKKNQLFSKSMGSFRLPKRKKRCLYENGNPFSSWMEKGSERSAKRAKKSRKRETSTTNSGINVTNLIGLFFPFSLLLLLSLEYIVCLDFYPQLLPKIKTEKFGKIEFKHLMNIIWIKFLCVSHEW